MGPGCFFKFRLVPSRGLPSCDRRRIGPLSLCDSARIAIAASTAGTQGQTEWRRSKHRFQQHAAESLKQGSLPKCHSQHQADHRWPGRRLDSRLARRRSGGLCSLMKNPRRRNATYHGPESVPGCHSYSKERRQSIRSRDNEARPSRGPIASR